MKRYKTGGYGAMVEDENGPWVEYAALAAPPPDETGAVYPSSDKGLAQMCPGVPLSVLRGIQEAAFRAGREDALKAAQAPPTDPPGLLAIVRELVDADDAVENAGFNDYEEMAQHYRNVFTRLRAALPATDPQEAPTAAPGQCPACGERDGKHGDWCRRREFWLGEHGRPGIPLALMDGPHDDRAGVERAAYLIPALGLGKPARPFVCVEAVVTPVTPSADGVDHGAVAQNRRAAERSRRSQSDPQEAR